MLPHPHDSNFPSALKARRLALGLSREKLAELSGLHKVMPRRYEEPDCGEAARPKHENWLALNRALGYEVPDQDTPGGNDLPLPLPAMPASTDTAPTDSLLLKDASLDDIVKFLHSKNIEPTFRHLMRR